MMGKFSWVGGFWSVYLFKIANRRCCEIYIKSTKASQKTSFRDEYIEFLKKFNIEYDEKYLIGLIDCIAPNGAKRHHAFFCYKGDAPTEQLKR